MATRGAVLFVDDEALSRDLFARHFGHEFPVIVAPDAEAALATLRHEHVAVVVTNERLPRITGIELLARLVERHPEVICVLVSVESDAGRLLRAVSRGPAHEYLVKPWSADEMRECLVRSLDSYERRRALAERVRTVDLTETEPRRERERARIVGEDGALAAVVGDARRAALSDATVLLLGETGTGKERLARLIHEASPRATRAFVRVGCSALSEGVLESELFGHERGAFTSAVRARRGRFEAAHLGTIFLDEIGDISPKLQMSLLRVLQERVVERVGNDTPIPVDVRVIAATHRDLAGAVAEGTFRADLFYRLNVIPIMVPPLRERAGDIPALVEHLLRKHGGANPPDVSREAMAALVRYPWPGNVRELENMIERALVMQTSGKLSLQDFVLDARATAPRVDVRDQARAVEAEDLRRLLLDHSGNVSRAARTLGIPRTTLLARVRKHGLLGECRPSAMRRSTSTST